MSFHSSSRARKARVCALQMLYQREVTKDSPDHVKETYWKEVNVQAPQREFADELFDKASAELPEVDALIRAHARRWKVERMAAVDRNLLRLAITEFRHYPETPPAVVINEALEIAKLFSGDDSLEFLNGVLDSVRKELEARREEVAGEKTPPNSPSHDAID